MQNFFKVFFILLFNFFLYKRLFYENHHLSILWWFASFFLVCWYALKTVYHTTICCNLNFLRRKRSIHFNQDGMLYVSLILRSGSNKIYKQLLNLGSKCLSPSCQYTKESIFTSIKSLTWQQEIFNKCWADLFYFSTDPAEQQKLLEIQQSHFSLFQNDLFRTRMNQ